MSYLPPEVLFQIEEIARNNNPEGALGAREIADWLWEPVCFFCGRNHLVEAENGAGNICPELEELLSRGLSKGSIPRCKYLVDRRNR